MTVGREQTNYYEILEVAPDASGSEIHKAYQRARQTYSQDNPALYSMFSQDEARELLRLIDEAYAVLGNQANRQAYDQSRGGPVSLAPSKAQPATATVAAIDDSIGGEFVVKHRPAAKPPMPDGQARTQLSTYKLDDSFESEIASQTEFDGGFLQRIRLYKNISIDKMSEATRISRPYLMAVETNDYKSLPAAVFVRGFIVQVARLLGIDENKAAASYMKLFKAGGGK